MKSSNTLVAYFSRAGKFICSSCGISFGILLLKCNSIQRGCLVLVNWNFYIDSVLDVPYAFRLLGYSEMWDVRMCHKCCQQKVTYVDGIGCMLPISLEIYVSWVCTMYIVCWVWTLILALSGIYLGLKCKLYGFCGSVYLERCTFVLNMLCQLFEEHVTVKYLCWNWIYRANTWGMNVR